VEHFGGCCIAWKGRRYQQYMVIIFGLTLGNFRPRRSWSMVVQE
jgi:hypothetical protein